jgi:archaellum component FlaC
MFFEKFNPLNENFDPLTMITNTISESIQNTPLQTLVEQVNEGTQNLYNITTQNILPEQNLLPEVIPEVAQEKSKKKELSEIERLLKKAYEGCFPDDPTDLTMKTYLGEVRNPIEGIKLGKENGYKYIGIQQGGKCYASNTLPTGISDNANCNYKFNNFKNYEGSDWYYSTCGGYYYNKVFNTNIEIDDEIIRKCCRENISNEEIKKETKDMIEGFDNLNKEIDMINSNVNHNNLLAKEPLNPYYLLLWLLVILFIIFLMIEYFNKKNTNNINV